MGEFRDRIASAVAPLRADAVTLLAGLVRARSENPPGDTREAVEVAVRALEGSCDAIETIAFDETRPNVVARIGSGRPALLFNSHIDTVPVGDPERWKHPPFDAEEADGSLHGRGVADAKGCVAAMIVAARAYKQLQPSPTGSLIVHVASDEEVGGERYGTGRLVAEGLLQPDCVVIGEITGNQLAIAHKGVVWGRLVARGRSAHASTPWEGRNAIADMAQVLAKLQARLAERFAGLASPWTPPASFNVGTIQGGTKTNVVAESCEATIDRRILPAERPEQAVVEIEEVIAEVGRESPGLDVTFERILFGSPLYTSPSSPFVLACQEALRRLGRPETLVGYKQASDGRFFSERGIPTVLMGPGVAEVAHTPDEHLVLQDYLDAIEIYAALGLSVLAAPAEAQA